MYLPVGGKAGGGRFAVSLVGEYDRAVCYVNALGLAATQALYKGENALLLVGVGLNIIRCEVHAAEKVVYDAQRLLLYVCELVTLITQQEHIGVV